jgi:uncharacterized protein (TIGR03000 family)
MYSLILMTAMATGAPEAPSGILFNRCGCCGGGYSSCYGGCYGCFGACYGGYSYSSCYGCHGCYGYSACNGCHGCWGSTYGCAGCCGGCTGSSYGVVAYGGVWGATYTYSDTIPFGPPSFIPTKVTEPVPLPKKLDGKSGDGSARLIIEVPENAKLYIDDKLMKTATAERLFYTPPLAPGQKYFYDVRVEVEKDGQPVSQSKRVIVEAGASVRESFRNMAGAAVANSGK